MEKASILEQILGKDRFLIDLGLNSMVYGKMTYKLEQLNGCIYDKE